MSIFALVGICAFLNRQYKAHKETIQQKAIKAN
jgi:hypothetical protein